METRASLTGRQAASGAERTLLALGLVALLRVAMAAVLAGAASERPGAVLDVRPEVLSGAAFRLWPGVGPALAGRLEVARVAAGGVLTVEDLRAVSGVGPGLMERWGPLWALSAASGVR